MPPSLVINKFTGYTKILDLYEKELEIDFIDCPEGEEQSLDSVRQRKVAEAVTLGVLDWLHLQGKKATK